MEKITTLVNYFKEEEIEEIKDYLVEYSIRKYEEKLKQYKMLHWQKQYKNALTLKKESIDSSNQRAIDLTEKTTSEIRDFLQEKQEKYTNNILDNQMITKDLTPLAIQIFRTGVGKNKKGIERASYLFDFVTSIITPATDYYKYCLNIPLTNYFAFDFKDSFPIDHNLDVESMLIQRQGTADDVCNLMIALGKELNLLISKEFVIKNGQDYPVNKIKFGQTYTYVDAYAKISGEKGKDACFLKSINDLSTPKVKFQQRTEEKSTTIDYKAHTSTYDLEKTLEKLNKIMPDIEVIDMPVKQLQK